jgi:YD repeat-containing protein
MICTTSAQITIACLANPRIAIGAGAQNECTPTSTETVCIPYGDTTGLGGCACGKPKASCPPPSAVCETCPHCGGQNTASNPSAMAPISLTSGNTYIRQTDIKQLPGLGAGIGIGRVWNSLWPATQSAYNVGIFGVNWRSTYEERIFVGTDGYIKYARADGSFWSFGVDGSGNAVIAAPSMESASLSSGTSYWTVIFKNGEQRLFDINSGHLISIIDRNGNTTTLSYDFYGRLTKVVDPLSRYLIFLYGSGDSEYLVVQVTSSVGHVVTYTYNQQRLMSVTEPDGTLITFAYNDPNQNLITTVMDANGKILEAHTYDSTGRGLSAVRANGVDAVTVSYQDQ